MKENFLVSRWVVPGEMGGIITTGVCVCVGGGGGVNSEYEVGQGGKLRTSPR